MLKTIKLTTVHDNPVVLFLSHISDLRTAYQGHLEVGMDNGNIYDFDLTQEEFLELIQKIEREDYID